MDSTSPSSPAPSTSQMLELSAVEVLAAFRRGDFSSQDYVRALLARANELRSLNTWVTLNGAAALEAAREIDEARARGDALGPLAGLPLYVKDNIDTKGIETTAATPALRGFLPARNAPVLDPLLRAGAIVLAKANMHELAFGSTSSNAACGFVQNPYDITRIPGGSSGGTAAGIAARIAPAGLGTDTGASVRNPASFCGIVGLRPSVGNGGKDRRYPGAGVVPISRTRDTVGPMARNVADVALLDAVITGTEGVSPASLAGLRLGLPRGGFWENLDSEVEAVTSAAVEKLRAAGVVFVEADLEGWAALNAQVSMPVALYEFYHRDLPAYLKERDIPLGIEDVIAQVESPDVKGIFGFARDMPAEVYEQAMRVHRPQLMALYARYFEKHAVEGVLFPTVPILPPPIDPGFSGAVSINDVPQDGGPAAQFQVLIRNVDPGSNAGLPGLAQPAGMSASGLPVGLEIDGPLGSDRRLLAIGLAIEAVLGLPPAPDI
ncbi:MULTISPECIES: indoleacetamide hydrolase [unclassified Variovorax]|uniref:indoleacetamide hydrolase n=1 Tax=unclassified Variovorax TaxID=663243 RepID=UPI001BD4D72E|nr:MULTISPECIES: indoleacetamide hydrolase [unclassified Variovorax]